jgi:hypothetical protein
VALPDPAGGGPRDEARGGQARLDDAAVMRLSIAGALALGLLVAGPSGDPIAVVAMTLGLLPPVVIAVAVLANPQWLPGGLPPRLAVAAAPLLALGVAAAVAGPLAIFAWAGALPAAFFIAAMADAARGAMRRRRALREGVDAAAVVTGLRWESGDHGADTCVVEYRFLDPGGAVREGRAVEGPRVLRLEPALAPGDWILVRYVPPTPRATPLHCASGRLRSRRSPCQTRGA